MLSRQTIRSGLRRGKLGLLGHSSATATAVIALLHATIPTALAADLPDFTPEFSPVSADRWSGLYYGFQAGGVSVANTFDLFGYPESVFAGFIPPQHSATRSGTAVFGAQAGYNAQFGAFVIGGEQDIIWSSTLGTLKAEDYRTGTTLTGAPFSNLQTQRLNWLSTTRLRTGYLLDNGIMLYATGGLAYGSVDATTNLGTAFQAANNSLRVGWAAGGGLEYAMTEDLSATLEYLHFALDPSTTVATAAGTALETHTRQGLTGDIVRVGINYRPDPVPMRFDGERRGFVPKEASDLRTTIGLRYWYSTGRLAKDLYSDLSGTDLVSRLTYSNLTANSAETFARVDHVSGLFVKGYGGLGSIASGKLRDEDFPPGISPYSSTDSEQKSGKLNYITADVGYSALTGAMYKLSPFVGFNYQREQVNAHGCAQTATNPVVCAPTINSNYLTITEDAHWASVRVGLNAELTLWNGLKFEADAAWLPWTNFWSADTHWLRIQPLPGNFNGAIPQDGIGSMGVQLEGILSYDVTSAFSVGIGGRYWRIDTPDSIAHFEGRVSGVAAEPQKISFTSERYGAFLQGAYRF